MSPFQPSHISCTFGKPKRLRAQTEQYCSNFKIRTSVRLLDFVLETKTNRDGWPNIHKRSPRVTRRRRNDICFIHNAGHLDSNDKTKNANIDYKTTQTKQLQRYNTQINAIRKNILWFINMHIWYCPQWSSLMRNNSSILIDKNQKRQLVTESLGKQLIGKV